MVHVIPGMRAECLFRKFSFTLLALYYGSGLLGWLVKGFAGRYADLRVFARGRVTPRYGFTIRVFPYFYFDAYRCLTTFRNSDLRPTINHKP